MQLPRFLLDPPPHALAKNKFVKPPCATLPHHLLSTSPRNNTNDLCVTLAYPIARESMELGEHIANDLKLLNDLGWDTFVKSKRGWGNIGLLDKPHTTNRLLKYYKNHGAPVCFSTNDWTPNQILEPFTRVPQKSCNDHSDFLQEEFICMIQKDQWCFLPLSITETLIGLCLSPPLCHRSTWQLSSLGRTTHSLRNQRWDGNSSLQH